MFAIIKTLNLFFVRAKLKVFLFILFTLIAIILEIFSIGLIFPVFSTLLSNEPLNINFPHYNMMFDIFDNRFESRLYPKP